MDTRGRLQLFLGQVAELRDTRLWREQRAQFGFTLKYDADEGMSVSLDIPEKDAVKDYLVSLRPFVSASEPVHMSSIYKLCLSNSQSDEIRRRLAEWRDRWKRIRMRPGLAVTINDRKLMPTEMFDLFVNAIFHADAEKRQRLAELDPMDTMFHFQVFGDFLVGASEQAIRLSWIVEDMLKQELAVV